MEALDPAAMLAYGRLCARTVARAHARTGDPIAIGSYLGSGTSFDRAIAEFWSAYADQNERDHAALLDARRHPANQPASATVTGPCRDATHRQRGLAQWRRGSAPAGGCWPAVGASGCGLTGGDGRAAGLEVAGDR